MDSPTLWGDRFAPVTSAIGFLRAPLDEVSVAYLAWFHRVSGYASAVELSGSLLENVTRLEPLTFGGRPRVLLSATSDPEWTATFDCSASGSDPQSSVPHLSRTIGVDGVSVVSIPDVPAGSSLPLRYGARQFELYGPDRTEFINEVRSVSLVKDGARWRFDATGTIQEFEDTEAYSRRSVAQRFTGQMLVDYAAALGLHPFDGEFYPGPCVLITHPAVLPKNGLSMSIRQAQRHYGIVPQND